MKILFDQGVPVPLRKVLPGHEIITAFEQGWSAMNNGSLLAAAEQDGFELMITTDKNLRYQQNLGERKIAIVVLPTTRWPVIQRHVDLVCDVLKEIQTGDYRELTW